MKEYISKPELNLFLSIIIPLLAFGVGWGIMSNRVDHLDKMTAGLQDQLQLQRDANQEICVRLAEIQKDIVYIRAELDKSIK